ncbi:MAG: hypothetical protein J7578_01340 [Chitinophagaceae bacterium]|nr:hypothetical protein [Chitinophagaceae bacterium]
MKEFKLSKTWVNTTWVVAPVIIIAVIYTIFGLEGKMKELIGKPAFYWIVPAAGGVLIVLMIYAMYDAVKSRFVITSYSVFIEYPFARRELSIREINGYKEDEYYFYIIPFNKTQKRIRVSKFYEKNAEISAWLYEQFGQDFDSRAAIAEQDEILANEDFGVTEKDRSNNLRKVKIIAGALNVGGVLAGGWAFFWPHPFELSIPVAIAFPLVSAMLMRNYNGLAKLEVDEKTQYAKLNWAYLGPAFGLALLALSEYNILGYKKIWIPSLLFTGVLVLLVLSGRNMMKVKKTRDGFALAMMILFFFGYGYGAAVLINCGFDHSIQETKKTTIVKKRVSRGRSKSYYIEVRLNTELPEGLKVSRKFYSQVGTGDEILLDYRKGLLGTPWVDLRTADGLISTPTPTSHP